MAEYYNTNNKGYEKVAKRKEKFVVSKIEILNHNESVIAMIADDFIADSDNISFSYSQGVQGKCSFNIIDKLRRYTPNKTIEDSYFWFGKKIKIYKGLYDVDNGDIYWWLQGVFVITECSRKDSIISVSCVDKFGIFTQDTGFSFLNLNGKIELTALFHEVVRDLIATDMGNGNILDVQRPLIDAGLMNLTIGKEVVIPQGGYIGDVIIEMCNAMKCRVYYDRFGFLNLKEGTLDYNFSYAAPVWDFDDEFSAEYVNSSQSFDFTSMINQITVWGEDFNGRYYTGTAINDNPLSPARVSLIGRRIGKTIENLYGYNQDNVNAFAEFILEMNSVQGIKIPVTTTLLPHLQVGDVVSLTNSDYGYNRKRFLINELVINGGMMTLSLVNIDYLLYRQELQF